VFRGSVFSFQSCRVASRFVPKSRQALAKTEHGEPCKDRSSERPSGPCLHPPQQPTPPSGTVDLASTDRNSPRLRAARWTFSPPTTTAHASERHRWTLSPPATTAHASERHGGPYLHRPQQPTPPGGPVDLISTDHNSPRLRAARWTLCPPTATAHASGRRSGPCLHRPQQPTPPGGAVDLVSTDRNRQRCDLGMPPSPASLRFFLPAALTRA